MLISKKLTFPQDRTRTWVKPGEKVLIWFQGYWPNSEIFSNEVMTTVVLASSRRRREGRMVNGWKLKPIPFSDGKRCDVIATASWVECDSPYVMKPDEVPQLIEKPKDMERWMNPLMRKKLYSKGFPKRLALRLRDYLASL